MVNIFKRKRSWVELTAIYLLFVVLCLSIVYSFKLFSSKDLSPQKRSNKGFEYSLSYFIDHEKSETVDSLLVTQFTPIDKNLVPFSPGLENKWVKIDVANLLNDTQELAIHFDNSMINEIDVHQINGFKIEKSWFLGAKRKGLKTNDNVFPSVNFSLESNQHLAFLVRIKTDGAPAFPVIVYSQERLEQVLLHTTFLYGGFIAILFTLIVYNLIIYKGIKDRLNLVYACYLASMGIMLAITNGYAYFIFPQGVIDILRFFLIFFHYTTAIILLFFTLELFELSSKSRLYKTSMVLIKAMTACALATLFLPEYIQANIFFAFQGILYLVSIAIIAQHLSLKVSWSRYYVISWIPLFVGAALQPMVLLGFLEYSFFSRNSLIFGVSIEVMFIAFALTEKLRQMDRSRYQFLLYNANSGLPNFSLLREKADALLEQSEQFTLVVVNGQSSPSAINPCMRSQQEERFSLVMKATNAVIKHNNLVLPIDVKGVKLTHLRGYSLALLLNTTEQNLVKQFIISLQTTLANHLPTTGLNDESEHDVHTNYQIKVRSCADIIEHTLAEVINEIHIDFGYEDNEIVTKVETTPPFKFG